MKKSITYLYVLFLAISLTSCEKKEHIETINHTKPTTLKENILKLGFKEEDIIEEQDYYLVEGDIMFKKDTTSTKDILNVPPKTMQARSTNTVYLSNSQISIYVDQSASTWAEAVDDAIAAYNNLGNTVLTLYRTYSPASARITVKIGPLPREDLVGAAGFPINGLPYNEIVLNNNFSYYSRSQKHLVVAHEIGHCLGLRHTNWHVSAINGGPQENEAPEGAIQIANTPSTDVNSIMNHNVGGLYWNGFSQYDIVALRSLFPIIINVGISGPSVGNNEGFYSFSASASGGTPPYTLNWYYSYNNYTEPTTFWFTGASINNINLPYQMDLHIKVIATDALGSAGVARKFVLNRWQTRP